MSTLTRSLFLCFALLLSGSLLQVWAQDKGKLINPCEGVKDDAARLKCLDELMIKLEKNHGGLPIDWDRILNQKAGSGPSLLEDRWELESDLGDFIFRPYKPVYFFPVFYKNDPNEQPTTDNPLTSVTEPLNLDHTEAKFQISFKTKMANDLLGGNADLWLGYTQTSRWQIYNSKESRPFRETNHEPEFILAWHTKYNLLGYRGRLFSLSLNHQSNGQDEPQSRSWNRVIATIGLEKPDWVIQFRPWWRIPETSDEEDENPDISDYLGRAELLVVHRRGNTHQISTLIRHSLKGGKESRGSIALNWSYPCFDRLRCHAQIFSGYGESLIDYNHRSTTLGLGVALLEWY